MINEYSVHCYQIEKDKLQWSSTVDSVSKYGRIYHLDYSNNLQFSPKFEPQLAHFNKNQYLLHCTVAHCFEERVYNKNHLSNDTNHDSQFTLVIVSDLKKNDESLIFHFKSDHCAQQYKSRYVFGNWKDLPQENNKTLIVYYVASWHGKGLVDSMSSFGVKAPIRESIVTEFSFFFFNDVEQVKIHLEQKHIDKPNWLYKTFSIDEPEGLRIDKRKAFEIKGCEKIYMIAFFPGGQVFTMQNLCCCNRCIIKNFNFLQNQEM